MKGKDIKVFLLSTGFTLLIFATCVSLCKVAAISQEKGLFGYLGKEEISVFSIEEKPLQKARAKISQILEILFKMPLSPI